VCNGYLPTELTSEEECKMGCAECDCWCHFTSPIQTEPIATTRRLYAPRFATCALIAESFSI
jgi:hypothetical protein